MILQVSAPTWRLRDQATHSDSGSGLDHGDIPYTSYLADACACVAVRYRAGGLARPKVACWYAQQVVVVQKSDRASKFKKSKIMRFNDPTSFDCSWIATGVRGLGTPLAETKSHHPTNVWRFFKNRHRNCEPRIKEGSNKSVTNAIRIQ